MDLTKEIRRQVQGEDEASLLAFFCSAYSSSPALTLPLLCQGAVLNLTFNVKFYPPDPAQLSEDITR